ncbi:hemerythrin HHE cation binding domain-containing protein [Janthinobacterium sp. 64]|nr:hemerythrin HHE cation binding domain-containing protein [Janthinobacterium sp. 64]
MATQSPQAASVSQTQAGMPDMDAIELLTQDHQTVKDLFEQYEGLSDRSLASKRKLALKICEELSKHAMVEEEIFYPAVRDASRSNEDLVDEAIVEHASAKELIAQIVAMEAGEDLYDAKVKVLSEQIDHHVLEEEGEIFPRARDAELDLQAMGSQIAARKAEIELPDMQA